VEERLQAWEELMRFGDQMFLAGLPLRSRPDEDEWAAIRRSYARHVAEQDRKLIRMMQRFEANHGR